MEPFSNTFAEKIAHLCYRKFERLPKSGKPIIGSQWTSLAAIIKHEVGLDFQILSLATGSKCIGKSKLSLHGDVINDSHAEVLARRGFLRYLYEQIELIDEGKSDIFSRDALGKINLRDGVSFHLFTSRTPCGDACIFPQKYTSREEPSGIFTSESTKRRHSSGIDLSNARNEECKKRRLDSFGEGSQSLCIDSHTKVRMFDNSEDDIHRTGAKCLPNATEQDPKLPGTKYHIVGAVRTKPGRGDRTSSVSCSDKILRWNYVGIQGALLAFLIEPIFLSSVIISCDEKSYSRDAMYRAVVYRNPMLDRIRSLKDSPVLTHVRVPFKYSRDLCKTETCIKAAPCSIVWCDLNTNKNQEVYVEGRKLGQTRKRNFKCSEPLFLSKLQFLHCFKRLFKSKFDDLTYEDCKMLSTDYQEKWSQFKTIIGQWTEKDKDLYTFK